MKLMKSESVRATVAIFFLVVSFLTFDTLSNVVNGAGSVTVSATVTTAITCTVTAASTAFGTLLPSAVASSTPNATSTLACNTALGCSLTINDLGSATGSGLPGLVTTTGSGVTSTIVSTSTLLTVGNEGYGIQATTTGAGGGNAITLNTRYNVTSTAPWVGGLFRSATTLASSTAALDGTRQVLIAHYASISATTTGAIYSDTITYSCASN